VTELEVRHLAGEAWARMENSQIQPAIELLNRARMLAEAPEFSTSIARISSSASPSAATSSPASRRRSTSSTRL
jgi:hypothetical protein